MGTWDIFEDNAYEAAVNAGVLDMPLLIEIPPISLNASLLRRPSLRSRRAPRVRRRTSRCSQNFWVGSSRRDLPESRCRRCRRDTLLDVALIPKSDPGLRGVSRLSVGECERRQYELSRVLELAQLPVDLPNASASLLSRRNHARRIFMRFLYLSNILLIYP